jgi:hypothetical protein
MLDVEITFNKKLLNKILKKLISLEHKMATLEQNTAMIADIAAQVAANTDLVSSVATITEKIFAEVEALVAAANVDIPGLSELKQATLDQNALLVAAAGKSTEVDGLIPDLPGI